jgi:hypothetical protein
VLRKSVFGLICVMFVIAVTSCGDAIEEGQISIEQVAKRTQPSILELCGTYDFTVYVDCSEMEFPTMMQTCISDGGCNSTQCTIPYPGCPLYEVGDAWCPEGYPLKCRCGCHSPP